MNGSLDEVKVRILSRVPLGELIGESVNLTLRSGHRVGCCPFHSEKSPSFYVYDDHYHCFGCKAHGDAISFVRQTQGLSFVESLRFLAAKFSVDAPELEASQADLTRRKRTASLYELMLAAQEFYVAQLHTPEGEAARSYLSGRGFTQASIQSYGFGLTPAEPFGLVRHLRNRGFKEASMLECSLSTESTRDRRHYDFFRNRVLLPIHDAQGRIIAFGGRTMDGHPAKYMNSRDTSLFDKSRTLYGFDRARKVMREKGRAIIVEGYMDACMLWQQGYPESVACLGTAFTEHHMKLLRQATAVVVLLFDGDKAGRKATLDSVELALSAPEMQIKAVRLPDQDDPDDFLRKHGSEALEELIGKAENLLDFAVRERLRETHELAIPELLGKELIPWVAKVPDRLQRGFLITRLSFLTGLPAQQIAAELDATLRSMQGAHRAVDARQDPRAGATARSTPDIRPLQKNTAPRPLDQIAFDLLGHVFYSQAGEIDGKALLEFVAQDLEIDSDYQQFLEEMLQVLNRQISPASADAEIWASSLSPAVAQLMQRLRTSSQAFANSQRQEQINKLIAHTRTQKLKGTISTLRAQLARVAAQKGQDEEVQRLLRTITELTRDLQSSTSKGR